MTTSHRSRIAIVQCETPKVSTAYVDTQLDQDITARAITEQVDGLRIGKRSKPALPVNRCIRTFRQHDHFYTVSRRLVIAMSFAKPLRPSQRQHATNGSSVNIQQNVSKNHVYEKYPSPTIKTLDNLEVRGNITTRLKQICS
jgi:hypothetical protein